MKDRVIKLKKIVVKILGSVFLFIQKIIEYCIALN